MKNTFIALILLMTCNVILADTNDVNTLTLEQCRAKIIELKNIVQSQQNRIEKLIAALNKDSQPKIKNTANNTKPAVEFKLSDGIIYRGKKRLPTWFNYFYKQFYDKIVYYDGRYIEVSSQKYSCKILQVIDDNEAMVKLYGSGFDRCHIKGFKKPLIDDQYFSFNGYLINNGRYQYTTTLGSKATIASYLIIKCEPLTKEQFADAINKGFELYREVDGVRKLIP